jgi:uncharacterized protein (DUF1778 family)
MLQQRTGVATLAVSDEIRGIDEANSARMSFRTKPHVKATIQKAAALSGMDDAVFVMNAAYAAAVKTISAHKHTMLQPVDHAAFLKALNRPAAPTPRLRAAVARHKETIISK